MTHLQSVHVRVNEAGTGEPTPVRIRFTDPHGNYYPPLGRVKDFSTEPGIDVGGNLRWGSKAFAYIDGSCEVLLPPGPIQVEILKGFEFLPLRSQVQLAAGKLSMRFEVQRWTDLRKQNWFPGDMRAHILSPHAALLEGMAEDLAVVNLLAFERRRPHGVPLIEAFSGQTPCLEKAGHVVVVNTLNSHPRLGSLALLNAHRIVFPLAFGDDNDDWNLAAWCDQCHRKEGLVVWSPARNENEDFLFGEVLADLILGKVDAFELDGVTDSPRDALNHWYTLLNAGLRVPLTAGSGKDANDIALGCIRTYAGLPAGTDFSYKAWIEAIRAGRTFVTNGPILSLTVEGKDPGDTLEVGDQPIKIVAEAAGLFPYENLEIVVNGTIVWSVPPKGPSHHAKNEFELVIPCGGWVAARCVGSLDLPYRPVPQKVFAHTSPIYLQATGQRTWQAAEAVEELRTHLQDTLRWLETEGLFEQDKFRDQLREILIAARNRLPASGERGPDSPDSEG